MEEFEKLIMDIQDYLDQHPIGWVILAVVLAILIIWNRKQRVKKNPEAAPRGDFLSQIFFYWSLLDPVSIRDFLRSMVIFGATGSGKTSGSGYLIAKAMAACNKVSGIIFASKPEDREFWEKIFAKAGRELRVFSAASLLRFNFIDFILKNGGDTREITKAVMVISDTVEQNGGEGRNNDPFWRRQNERMIYNAVEVVRLATGTVTAPDIQKYINTAALTPEALGSEGFKKSYHYQCLDQARKNLRTDIDRYDFDLAMQYWKDEYPGMSEKTRSSILAGVMGILHVFNTGIVRDLVSTGTNWTPAVAEQGVWTIIDLPISSYGAAGAFILGGIKYLTQWYILKRKVSEDSPAIVIHCDEAQKIMNSEDTAFLAECRSHRGCMVYLTQSLHSFYSRIQGKAGEHETDALLTNFYHKCFHALGDDKSASFGSSLVGERMHTDIETSGACCDDPYEGLWGTPKINANTKQGIRKILENREFMQGFRTGGPENDYIVDGLVVRSGTPFSNGESYLRVAFNQRD